MKEKKRFIKDGITIDMNTTKIWFSGILVYLIKDNNNFVSFIIQNRCKFTLERLYLGDQHITYHELSLLTNSTENLRMCNSKIVNDDGSLFSICDILNLIPNALEFHL